MSIIKHVVKINSRPEDVFGKTVEPDGLKEWWTRSVKGDPEAGGQLEFRFSSGASCAFTVDRKDITEGVTRWTCVNGDKEWLGTQVTFIFKPDDGATRLVFEHTGWREPTDFFGFCNYHWGQYLKSLKDYCESGKGSPNSGSE